MNINRRAVSAALGMVVAACGGGGDDGGSAAAVAATKNVAIDGVTVSFFTGRSTTFEWAIVGGTVAGLSGYPGSVQGIDLSNVCASGSASADIVKAGTYSGFAAGDKATISFRKCTVSPTTSIDGSVTSTILVPLATPVGKAFAMQARLEPSAFSISAGAITIRYLGTTDFSVNSTSARFDSELSIPAGGTLMAEISGNTHVIYSYLAGTTYRGSDTSTTFTRKLDGTISVAPFGAPQSTLTVATPTAFAGTNSSGSLVASKGVMNVLEKTGATSGVSAAVSVGDASVRVDGDVNLDGAVDASFDATWSELLGL